MEKRNVIEVELNESEVKEAVKEYLEKRKVDVKENEITFEKGVASSIDFPYGGIVWVPQIICKVIGIEKKESE